MDELIDHPDAQLKVRLHYYARLRFTLPVSHRYVHDVHLCQAPRYHDGLL